MWTVDRAGVRKAHWHRLQRMLTVFSTRRMHSTPLSNNDFAHSHGRSNLSPLVKSGPSGASPSTVSAREGPIAGRTSGKLDAGERVSCLFSVVACKDMQVPVNRDSGVGFPKRY